MHCRELEELEAIKEAEEAALAEAEAAAAEAAEAMGDYLDGFVGGGIDDKDSPPDSPGADINGAGRAGRIIDVVEADDTVSSIHSPSRGSINSGMNKYSVKQGSMKSDIYRSFENGVDHQQQQPRHPQHVHHSHYHQKARAPHHQSSTDVDHSDRMSVRSATLSVYRSEDSLAARGAAAHPKSGEEAVGNGGKLGSLPTSPFVRRASKSNSFGSHIRLHEKYGGNQGGGSTGGGKKQLVLFTYLDAQEHLPYADDSNAVTPKSEANGFILVDTPTRINLARRVSYTSHTGKVDSYNSHTDLRTYPTSVIATPSAKESSLRRRMASLFSDMAGSRSGADSLVDHHQYHHHHQPPPQQQQQQPLKSTSSTVLQPISSQPTTSAKAHFSAAASIQRQSTQDDDPLDLQVRSQPQIYLRTSCIDEIIKKRAK